jgi:hypothetical protein
MSGVKEPNGCIDADAKTMKFGGICFKTINDSNVSKRPQSSGGSEDLSDVRGSILSS